MPRYSEDKFQPPYEPLIPPRAIEYLSSRVEGARVLEVGAGKSTIWFSERANSVTSLETDRRWHGAISRVLGETLHVNLVLVKDPAQAMREMVAEFDIILIDCQGKYRIPCIKAAPRLLSCGYRMGSYLVVDDTHWAGMTEIVQWVDCLGWTRRDFCGRMWRNPNRKTDIEDLCVGQKIEVTKCSVWRKT